MALTATLTEWIPAAELLAVGIGHGWYSGSRRPTEAEPDKGDQTMIVMIGRG